ncbi:uncharacterized protein VTP21DRAFT_10126 [Calcarisporiella thermophila]|uniref:uncharacterized protein n=1 Tax=Calcarisporiella thermophila TaxID=911321 RepID=UPI003742E82A
MSARTKEDPQRVELPPFGHALSGAIGSALANFIVYPLDLATTHLQIARRKGKHTNGILETIRQLYQTEGEFSSLYSGILPDTVQTVLSNFIFFYAYSSLRGLFSKRNLKYGNKQSLSSAQELLVGALAGIISRFFTTPISVVTLRKQTLENTKAENPRENGNGITNEKDVGDSTRSKDRNTSAFPSTLSIIEDIFEEKGITGFWTGYRASVILTSNPSITYFLFQKFQALYLSFLQASSSPRNYLTALEVFLFSAFSKSIATMVTYPLIFAKTHLVYKETPGHGSKDKPTVQYKRIGNVIQHVLREEGIKGIYRGMKAQVIKGFFNHGLLYLLKDRVTLILIFILVKIRSKRLHQ